MRVTHQGMYSSYSNTLQKRMQDVNNAIIKQNNEGRKFNKSSDNVSLSYSLRKMYSEMQRNEVYLNNASTLKSSYTQAYNASQGISESLDSARANLERAATGSFDEQDMKNFAVELRELQKQIVAELNQTFSDKYLFNGAKTDEAPFSFDPSTNTLLFRGVDVNTITTNPSEARYVDIGLGLSLDSSGNVVPGSAFDASFNALDFLGFGVDGSGEPMNIVVLLGELADEFENPSSPPTTPTRQENLTALFTKQQKQFAVSVTAIGAKENFLDNSIERLESSIQSIFEKIDTEGYDDLALVASEITWLQTVYQAALQAGAGIMGMSLMDYLR